MTAGKIKVVTFMSGELDYFPFARKIHQAYCQFHGYEYVIADKVRNDRHLAWCKVLAVEEELRGCDYLFFLDADAFFYDRFRKLDELVGYLEEEYLMLFATNIIDSRRRWDPHKDERRNPNSGVYLVRNSDLSRKILREWSEIPLKWPEYAFTWPVDQRGLEVIILPKYEKHIRVLVEDASLINGRDGTFIRHLSGMDMEARTQILEGECRRLTKESGLGEGD